MIIANELFDECFCPCDGIGRVCLNGSKITDENFPVDIQNEMMERDGEFYTPSCYSVDVLENGAMLYYSTYDGEFVCLGVVDNVNELVDYYFKNADSEDIQETNWRL